MKQAQLRVPHSRIQVELGFILQELARFSILHPFGLVLPQCSYKGVVSYYQIGLILPSVAEIHPKIDPSRCNLQFSICRHAGGKVLSLENQHSLFQDILFASICSTSTHRAPASFDYQLEGSSFRFLKTHLMQKVMKSLLLNSYYLLVKLRPC